MLKKHLELPLTKVPDPFEKYESFGAHNNQKLIEFLKKFGCKPIFIYLFFLEKSFELCVRKK